MKYIKVLFCLTLLFLIGITGCSQKEEITSINTVDVNQLEEYSGTYVGDNSKVIAIIRTLPGGETFKEIDLHNKTPKITYGAKGDELPEDEPLKYWFDGNDTLNKNFLYNAIYLTILIPNAKSYCFKMDNQYFAISREEMVGFISKNISPLPDGDELFKKEKAQIFIDNHKDKIDHIVKSQDFRTQFFKSFPIKEL
jgi:Domain of unknown function (DUF4825)